VTSCACTLVTRDSETQLLEVWLESAKSRIDWLQEIATRERQVSEEVYAALVEEAYKPTNRGWMNEMEISHADGGVFAWVKTETLSGGNGPVAHHDLNKLNTTQHRNTSSLVTFTLLPVMEANDGWCRRAIAVYPVRQHLPHYPSMVLFL
jgi:hypothetical protein